MIVFIITTALALTSAAQLPSRNYLPQSQGGVGSYQPNRGYNEGGSRDTGNRRPQQDAEKNAAVLRQEQEASEDGNYHFGYETSNGIRAEESGNTANAQGGFAYKGDDGITYTITYTAGEGGFRPQGEHIPVAPPIPEAILEGLKKNEQDEAAGIFDDGKYRPDQNNNGQYKPGSSSSGGNFGSSSHPGNGGYQY